MNYSETLQYLYTAAPAFEKVGAGAYKEGLSNTKALDAHFGHPHKHFRTIHVAGTNGKGSTSHTLAAFLQICGYRVGLYTSPHLVDFNERIRVNGVPVPHQYVIDFVEQERDFFEPLQPSFFELTTAMAFKYFAEQQVDIAVIEVGLGGRLDCTNIITPELCVITNISFDHTGFLGDTLAKIAAEKAGIIKAGIPVVIGETTPETRPVFEAKAREVGAPIFFAEDHPLVTPDLLDAYALKGACQQKNLNTILNAIEVFFQNSDLDTNAFLDKEGTSILFSDLMLQVLSSVTSLTGLRGRWEILHHSPLVICDTGHNLAAWQYLVPDILSTHQRCGGALHIVFGMVDDKDVEGVLHLLPRDAEYYFTQADTHRAIPVEKLLTLAEGIGLKGSAYPTVRAAYDAVMQQASSEDFVYIGGSSYVVADLLFSYELGRPTPALPA